MSIKIIFHGVAMYKRSGLLPQSAAFNPDTDTDVDGWNFQEKSTKLDINRQLDC